MTVYEVRDLLAQVPDGEVVAFGDAGYLAKPFDLGRGYRIPAVTATPAREAGHRLV